MNIHVKNSNDLNRLLDSLADEILTAGTCHRLYCNLVDAIEEYKDDIKHTPVFWHYTLISLREMRLLRLCRIYDQNSGSLNLYNLLDTIQENLHFFKSDEFKRRLKDNAFVESLATRSRKPNIGDLEKHLSYTSEKNPLVKKLVIWRNNIVAHRGAKLSIGKQNVLKANPLSKEELDELLDQALEIFNHYSSLFRASTWAKKAIGEDDYKFCLNLIRGGIRNRHQELQEKRRKIDRQN